MRLQLPDPQKDNAGQKITLKLMDRFKTGKPTL
jgi:hypothetical protein